MPDELEKLLTEIRDLQKDHLAEYRRVTEQMKAVQALAVKRQLRSLQFGVGALVLVLIGVAIMILRLASGPLSIEDI